MNIRKIDDQISVSPQIALADLATLASLGFRSVVCNRPDAEETGQPAQADIAAAASEAGLEYRFIPVAPTGLDTTTIAAFIAARREMAGPMLAFCRSGTRSTHLWALTETGRASVTEIIAKGASAGYDLSALSRYIDEEKS